MRERVIGTETEFGLSLRDGDYLSIGALHYALPKHLVMIGEGFLSNGGRLYLDHHMQFEYATPECLGIAEAVHAEIAGESVAYQTLATMVANESIQGFQLHKGVIDDIGTTWGYHENYLIDRATFNNPVTALTMLGHVATRNIFVGAGLWSPTSTNLSRVVPGQKAQDVSTDLSVATTSGKPVLNIRDEPHALGEDWARLHLTSGDANISPWATWMKLGTTSLVLRLVENGIAKPDRTELADPALTCREIAKDDSLQKIFDLMSGQQVRAVDIQEIYLEQCERMVEKMDTPKEEREVVVAWRSAVDDLRRDPTLLVGRSDWITRKYMLARFIAKHEIDCIDDESLSQANQTWHIIHPKAGVGIQKFRKLMTFPGYSESAPTMMFLSPPQSTRAKARGRLIKNSPRTTRHRADIDWEKMSVPGVQHYFSNPYETEAETERN